MKTSLEGTSPQAIMLMMTASEEVLFLPYLQCVQSLAEGSFRKYGGFSIAYCQPVDPAKVHLNPDFMKANMSLFGRKAALPTRPDTSAWSMYEVIVVLSALSRCATEFFSSIAASGINECLKFVVSLSTVDLMLPVSQVILYIDTVLMDFFGRFSAQSDGWQCEATAVLKRLSQAESSFVILTLNALKGSLIAQAGTSGRIVNEDKTKTASAKTKAGRPNLQDLMKTLGQRNGRDLCAKYFTSKGCRTAEDRTSCANRINTVHYIPPSLNRDVANAIKERHGPLRRDIRIVDHARGV